LLSSTTSFLDLPLVLLGSRELAIAFPWGLIIDSLERRTTVFHINNILGRRAQINIVCLSYIMITTRNGWIKLSEKSRRVNFSIGWSRRSRCAAVM